MKIIKLVKKKLFENKTYPGNQLNSVEGRPVIKNDPSISLRTVKVS